MNLNPPIPWKYVWATALVAGALLGIQPIIPYLISGRNIDFYVQSGPALLSVLIWACLSPLVGGLSSSWIESRGLARGARLLGLSLCVGAGHALMSLALFALPFLMGDDVAISRHLGVLVTLKSVQSWLEFWAIFALLYSIELDRRHRRQRVQLLTQQRDLFQTRLSLLQMQLQPHFVLNALNAVAAEMDEDRSSAQDMVARVGLLLRHMLRTDDRQTSCLDDERAYINAYLDFANLRFQTPIKLTWDCSAAALATAVPHLILQPLVENAIKHGGFRRDCVGWIRVHARIDRGVLILRVMNQLIEDRGSNRGSGIGLENTRGRLTLLYPEGFEFFAGEEGDGFVVELRLPTRGREAVS